MVILKIIVMTCVAICVGAEAQFDLLSVEPATYKELFNVTKTILNYVFELYDFAEDLKAEYKMRRKVDVILDQVNSISMHLDNFESRLDIKLDAMLNSLLDQVKVAPNVEYSKRKLCQYINRIDHYFDKSLVYTVGNSFDPKTLQRFGDSALWSGDNLPDILENLHDLMVPSLHKDGFVSSMLKQHIIKRQTDCNIHQSAQQRMFYTLMQVIVAETKGLATLEQIYKLQKDLHKNQNYSYEINIIKENFQRRLELYYKIMSQSLKTFPRDIRRCEPKILQYDVNFLEMVRLSRIDIYDVFDNHYREDCTLCPDDPNQGLYNCKAKSVQTIDICDAESGSRRDLLHWEDPDGVRYGPMGDCPGKKKKMWIRPKTIRMGARTINIPCSMCICSQDKLTSSSKSNDSVWHISVTDQIADLHNNMVVTGVRFVRDYDTIHIQIQQGNFSHTGMFPNTQSWKPLTVGYSPDGLNEITSQIHTEPLSRYRKTIYLDDILVPENCVVTGVRFRLVDNSAFMLQVLATEYDFARDQLIPYGSQWIDATTHPAMPKEYNRTRKEIMMREANDPTKAASFQYDLGSNKKIAFTHTDEYKDAGQTTIPLIDSQEVMAKPAFPLSGIGLSFRGRYGYGGFIALRIHTIDATGYAEVPDFSLYNKIKKRNSWSCKTA